MRFPRSLGPRSEGAGLIASLRSGRRGRDDAKGRRSAAPAPYRPGGKHFRADIEGLRAVAIVIALFAHAKISIAAGGYVGVDMFYVISGFVITGLLVREIDKSSTISLATFYARRIKRLLPAAVTVLLATVVIAQLLFSPVRGEIVARDVIAATLYIVNWRFISQQTDYFGATEEASPVQHYWSLSVEEQFYLVWPLLILGATWWWRRSGRSIRPALWTAMLALGAASLAYSVVYTAELPTAAYFSTLTRGWEFALGAIIALLALPRVPQLVAAVIAALGLAAIAIATLTYTSTTAFPGVAALLPAGGTAAVIAAGSMAASGTGLRVLTLRPVRYFGRISYSTYLWHWPAVIFAEAAWGPLTVLESSIAVAASIIPAAATYHFVEEPFRRSRRLGIPKRAMALGSSCMCVGVVGGALLLAAQPSFETAPASQVKGAMAIEEQSAPQRRAEALRPNPANASKDRGRLYDDGCLVEPLDTESGRCTYGNPGSNRSVVLFGDSHAMQYFPALEPIAERHRWRLVGLTKAGCPALDATVWNPRLGRTYDECDEWREHAFERIEAEEPRLIVATNASFYTVIEDGERVEDGEKNRALLRDAYAATLERLVDTGADVVVLEDLPFAPHEMPECVAESLDHLDRCAFEASRNRGNRGFDVEAAREVEGVKLIETTPWICPRGICRAVIGDAIVYRGTNHLTATFARTLAPRLERQLAKLGG